MTAVSLLSPAARAGEAPAERVADELRDARAQLAALHRSQAMIEFGLDGTVRWANKNFLALMGYTLAEVQGQHHRMFVDEAFAASDEYERFWNDLRAGRFHAGEFKRLGRDGREVWIQASYNPILDARGMPFKVFKCASDVTPLRRMVQRVARNAADLVSASTQLSAVGRRLTVSAESTSAQADVVRSASERVDANLQSVSINTDEMLANIREIDRAAGDAVAVSVNAVAAAERANEMVLRLGESGEDIRRTVTLISTIAEQTNLLALNAAIEAAHVGTAGRGFAVVAGEVKELARETARATTVIAARIEALQSLTRDAVGAITEIGVIIRQIDGLQGNIACAVQSQAGAAHQIHDTVSTAARGSREIVESIAEVARAAQTTRDGAGDAAGAAVALARMADDLQRSAAQVA